jgi:hypothetical protein
LWIAKALKIELVKLCLKQSKKFVANHPETTSEGTKLQAPVSYKVAKKPTDKNDLNSTTVRVPAPVS